MLKVTLYRRISVLFATCLLLIGPYLMAVPPAAMVPTAPNPQVALGQVLTFVQPVAAASLPGAFRKTYPANGQTDVPVNFFITWTPSAGASYYIYCVDLTLNSRCDPSGEPSFRRVTGSTTAQDFWGNPNTDYEVQVKAVNATGATPADGSGNWFRFRTGNKPGPFEKLRPFDGEVRYYNNVVLSWNRSVGSYFYKYCWDLTDNDSCDTQNWITTTATSQAIPASQLRPNQRVCWQVRAYRNTDYTAANGYGTWWCFSTR